MLRLESTPTAHRLYAVSILEKVPCQVLKQLACTYARPYKKQARIQKGKKEDSKGKKNGGGGEGGGGKLYQIKLVRNIK